MFIWSWAKTILLNPSDQACSPELVCFCFWEAFFHIPEAKESTVWVIEVHFLLLNCAITQFQIIKLSQLTLTPVVYMSALKFLFSAFICVELVSVSSPTNHAMWSKTSQLLPGSICIHRRKAGCNFYYFHWIWKQGNWQAMRSASGLFVRLFIFQKCASDIKP